MTAAFQQVRRTLPAFLKSRAMSHRGQIQGKVLFVCVSVCVCVCVCVYGGGVFADLKMAQIGITGVRITYHIYLLNVVDLYILSGTYNMFLCPCSSIAVVRLIHYCIDPISIELRIRIRF